MVRTLGTPLTVAEAKAPARTRVLVVADFTVAGHANEAEALATRLMQAGDVVITTSYQSLLTLRVADMILTAVLAKDRVDVALVEVYDGGSFRWAWWVTKALRLANVPVVHVLRGRRLTDFARVNSARLSELLAASSAVVAVSGYLYDSLASYGEIAEVIPQAIDAGAYPFRVRASAAPKLAWLGSFRSECDPQLGVRVLARLSERLMDDHATGTLDELLCPRLTMMGENRGDGARQATAAAERLGVARQLDLVGRVTRAEIPAQLAKADVYLNTADDDIAPPGLIEAMACGLCVVSSAGGGLPYLVRDGVEALLVPHGDPEAMAAAVERVVADPELAESLSRNARAKAESLDWSHALPKWRGLLHKVASQPGRTA